MKVLLLSPYPEKIERIITDAGDEVCSIEGDDEWMLLPVSDFIVSCGWRHIMPPAIIQRYGNRIINIHIGYLPWNRGADPNFWSWHDCTPKGVTIHQMDEGIDTGPTLAKIAISFQDTHTLKTSYEQLHALAIRLFENTWQSIREGEITSRALDLAIGTSHKKKDREAIWHHFPLGWDTPVAAVEEFGRKARSEHGTEPREATGA